jgi:hypothetical protein
MQNCFDCSEIQQPSLAARFRNLDSMYDSLPRSLKTEVLVRTKVEADEEVLKKRQLVKTTGKLLRILILIFMLI